MQQLLQEIPLSYTLIKLQYIFTLAFPLIDSRLSCIFWLPTHIQQATNEIPDYIGSLELVNFTKPNIVVDSRIQYVRNLKECSTK